MYLNFYLSLLEDGPPTSHCTVCGWLQTSPDYWQTYTQRLWTARLTTSHCAPSKWWFMTYMTKSSCALLNQYKATLCTTKVYVGPELHCQPWFVCLPSASWCTTQVNGAECSSVGTVAVVHNAALTNKSCSPYYIMILSLLLRCELGYNGERLKAVSQGDALWKLVWGWDGACQEGILEYFLVPSWLLKAMLSSCRPQY